jgi:hypothetical protein
MLSRSCRPVLIVLVALLVVVPARESAAACSQPRYVIAHRCNGQNDVSSVVAEEGVNAVEADFRFGRPNVFVDKQWYISHDATVYAWSLTADEWLADVKNAVNAGQLALIILDIKTPDASLRDLYQKVRNALGPDVNLIMSIGEWDDRQNFEQLLAFDVSWNWETHHLPALTDDRHLGLALDYLKSGVSQDMVRNYFATHGFPRYWFADGYAAGFATPTSVDANIHDGIRLRDEGCGGADGEKALHGVYTWTYEKRSSIEERLGWGVNGIFVNASQCYGHAGAIDIWQPRDVVNSIKSSPGAGYHFAAPSDDPFGVKVELVCPAPAVVECASTGGNRPEDAQIQSFFNAAAAETCNTAGTTIHPNGPFFYPVGSTEAVDFTMTIGNCDLWATCRSTVEVRDTIAPQITCPGDVEQDPSTPIVFGSPQVTDCCDPAPVWDCPLIGSFAPGTTTAVACTATDKAVNRSAPCTFSVKVRSTQEVVTRLQTMVASTTALNPGERNALTSELTSLLTALGAPSACGKLKGFTSRITNWIRTGHLPAAAGQPILTSSENLRKTLQCSW